MSKKLEPLTPAQKETFPKSWFLDENLEFFFCSEDDEDQKTPMGKIVSAECGWTSIKNKKELVVVFFLKKQKVVCVNWKKALVYHGEAHSRLQMHFNPADFEKSFGQSLFVVCSAFAIFDQKTYLRF